MFSGIALAYGDLPEALVETPDMLLRVHDRGGEREVRFLLRDAARVLPSGTRAGCSSPGGATAAAKAGRRP